jgi:hypothetical protein
MTQLARQGLPTRRPRRWPDVPPAGAELRAHSGGRRACPPSPRVRPLADRRPPSPLGGRRARASLPRTTARAEPIRAGACLRVPAPACGDISPPDGEGKGATALAGSVYGREGGSASDRSSVVSGRTRRRREEEKNVIPLIALASSTPTVESPTWLICSHRVVRSAHTNKPIRSDRRHPGPDVVDCLGWRSAPIRASQWVTALPPFLRRLALPFTIQSWSMTSLLQRLFKTGGRLIRQARYLILQLPESHLTSTLFRQILWRIERLAEHPA